VIKLLLINCFSNIENYFTFIKYNNLSLYNNNNNNNIIFIISIFDEDGGGTVDYKELIMGLEIFKHNSIDDKLKSKNIK
jgi:Ca2+-binding EF-hand superfamily protein